MKKKVTLSLVFLAVTIWCIVTLPSRLRFEVLSNTVEVAVEFDEIKKISEINNYPLTDLLDRLKFSGITTIVVDEVTPLTIEKFEGGFFISESDYKKLRFFDILTEGSVVQKDTLVVKDAKYARFLLSLINSRYSLTARMQKFGSRFFIFLPEVSINPEFFYIGFYTPIISKLKNYGFLITLRPRNVGKLNWINAFVDENVSSVIFEPDERFNFKDGFDIDVSYIDFEFEPAGVRTQAKISSFVRAHRVPFDEKLRISPKREMARFIRAVRERGVRYLLFNFDEKRTIDENLHQIKLISRRLKKEGYVLSRVKSVVLPRFPMGTLRKILAIAFSILMPAGISYLSLIFVTSQLHWFKSFVLLNIGMILGGLFITSFISSAEFILKLEELSGVKFVIFISFVFCIFVLFRPDELRKIVQTNLKVEHLFYAILGFSGMFLMIVRSGSISLIFPGEIAMREMFEDVLGVRPRWKEILIGQPFLVLGLKYSNKLYLLLSAVAAISIANTFWHAHTPLLISISRTLLGAIIGGIFGYGISFFIDAVKKISR